MAGNPKKPGKSWEYWTTVSYRSLTLVVVAVLIMGLSILLLLRPQIVENVLAMIAGGADSMTQVQSASYARFQNVEGSVRVRKRDSVQWAAADYRTQLEEGDVIQTGEQGLARIGFPDGTTYVVKPNTLIVIEQNTKLANQATRVSVQVSSGAVDLSTGSWDVPGSSSRVRFENAEADMNEHTRAAIRQDPDAQVSEITVTQGQAQLARGEETLQVGPYQRASFRGPEGNVRREDIVAPPELARPRHMEPIISSNPRAEVVRFQWSSVSGARRYRLRVSTSPQFANIIIDRVLGGTSYSARGLEPAEYWWTVRAVDANNRESPEAEPNRFMLAEQPADEQLLLVIEDIVRRGRVVEITGRTDAGAHVTINAEPVALVQADGSFRHFTDPLPAGAHTMTIVAQNRRGEVVTRKVPVLIE